MKVLEVISSLKPIGGGETFAVNFSRCACEMCDLKVVVLYKEASQMFIDRLKQKDVDHCFLEKSGHIDFKNARKLRKIIKSFNPDVIHTENNALIPTYLALLGISSKKRPYVFHTMHLEPSDECKNFFVRIMYKHILKKKKYVPVAITELLSEKSKAFYKLKNVPCVRNGIDLSRINSEVSLDKRKYDVAVIGRFAYQKNHEFLIQAFSKVKTIIPNFSVALIGDGELFNQMKKLADELNAGFIDFLGTMPNPGIVLGESKIIALGSRFEANPLSLLEGMAAGCIVVSSDVGGVRNIITKDNGFLFTLNDENAFIDIITNILTNVHEFSEMSKHNVDYSKQFSMESCVKNYLSVFENYLKDDVK